MSTGFRERPLRAALASCWPIGWPMLLAALASAPVAGVITEPPALACQLATCDAHAFSHEFVNLTGIHRNGRMRIRR